VTLTAMGRVMVGRSGDRGSRDMVCVAQRGCTFELPLQLGLELPLQPASLSHTHFLALGSVTHCCLRQSRAVGGSG
jgi:hypothetical protein